MTKGSFRKFIGPKRMLTLLVLAFFQVDPQVEKDIAALGSESYEERAASTQSLILRGRPILSRLAAETISTNDPEVKFRCQSVIDYHTLVSANNLPLIWYLPDEYRIVNGEDLALKYYREEAAKVNTLRIRVQANNYQVEYIAKKAMQSFIRDILGDFSTDRRTEILELYRRMNFLKEECSRYESIYGRDLIYDDINLSVEEVIKIYDGYVNGNDYYSSKELGEDG